MQYAQERMIDDLDEPHQQQKRRVQSALEQTSADDLGEADRCQEARVQYAQERMIDDLDEPHQQQKRRVQSALEQINADDLGEADRCQENQVQSAQQQMGLRDLGQDQR